jgi:peptide methionine sulfoxide reductase MsrA
MLLVRRSDFDKVDGVRRRSRLMGKQQPHYAQVSMGNTGHAEPVQLKFDPVISYQQLLDYWRHVVCSTAAGSSAIAESTGR